MMPVGRVGGACAVRGAILEPSGIVRVKWSQRLNDGKIPELEQEQEARLDELEHHLDQDPDSLEIKYHNAIGEDLRRQG